MPQVFIIGLPDNLRTRVQVKLNQQDIGADYILAGKGSLNRFVLFPDESHGAQMLSAYIRKIGEDYEQASVFVLPYAPIPLDLQDDLDTLEVVGGSVRYFHQACNGWPSLHPKKPKLDQPFVDAVYTLLICAVVGEQQAEVVLPSEHLRQAMAGNPELIVVGDAAELCDEVSPGRYPFLISAIDAFVELIRRKGDAGCELERFFAQSNLTLAQSGGITVDLDILSGGRSVRKHSCNTHLKKGDATTPQVAARVYYDFWLHENVFRVFLLYIGPHPERNLTRTYHLD